MEPGGLCNARAMSLMDSPTLQRSHNSSLPAADNPPGRPSLATYAPPIRTTPKTYPVLHRPVESTASFLSSRCTPFGSLRHNSRKNGEYWLPGATARGAVDMAKGEGRTFTINSSKDPQTLVEEARKAAEENNATFEGNTNSGSFSGKGVEGSYEVEGSTVHVTVTDKPRLAPWSKVKSKLEEFFN